MLQSQEKVETMLTQNLGGQRKSVMVFSEVAYREQGKNNLFLEGRNN